MEVIGAVASISQLVSYSFSVSKLLVQLAEDLTETSCNTHRNKVDDIKILQSLIKNFLETPKSFLPAHEAMLISLVIRISTTASRIRTLLNDLQSFSSITI